MQRCGDAKLDCGDAKCSRRIRVGSSTTQFWRDAQTPINRSGEIPQERMLDDLRGVWLGPQNTVAMQNGNVAMQNGDVGMQNGSQITFLISHEKIRCRVEQSRVW